MGDLYEPLGNVDAPPPPPPPTTAPGGGAGGPSKESRVFTDNVATGNTQASAVTNTDFGGGDGQSGYSMQTETTGKNKKKSVGSSENHGGTKRSGGACACMAITGVCGMLSVLVAAGSGAALFLI